MTRFRAIRRFLILLAVPSLIAGMLVAHFTALAGREPERRSPMRPIPRPELPGWLEQHSLMVGQAMAGQIDLLFLGDSITRGWLGQGRDPFEGDGLDLWQERFAPRRAANFGIGSDRIEHLLWRIRHGELSGRIDPAVVVLMIGTNNIGLDPPEVIAEGIATVVEEIRRRLPRSAILLMALTPRGVSPTLSSPPTHDRAHPDVARVNRLIAPLARLPRVGFIDFGSGLLDADGLVPRAHFPDYLHLSRSAYLAWADAIEPMLRIVLGAVPEAERSAGVLFGQDPDNRLGQVQVLSGRDLQVERRAGDDPARVADRLDELGVVGHGHRQVGAIGVGLAEPIEPERLRRLHGEQAGPGDGFRDHAVVPGPLQGVGDGEAGQGGAVGTNGLEDPVDHRPGREGTGRVVHGDEFAARVDPVETACHRVEPLGPALDQGDPQFAEEVAITILEPLAVLGGDGQDELGHVVATGKRSDRPAPDGSAVDLVVHFLPGRISEPPGLSGGRKNDGERPHARPSFGGLWQIGGEGFILRSTAEHRQLIGSAAKTGQSRPSPAVGRRLRPIDEARE
jgi:lysophospholipase L1-like esterase